MSSKYIISKKSPVYQSLVGLNFSLFFTKSNFVHILEFMAAADQKGYRGTISDLAALSLSSCHRTSLGKFLSQGKWNHAFYVAGYYEISS